VNRLERFFAGSRQQGRKALVVYVCAGDPDLATTERLVPELAKAGADIIAPSDMMDGRVGTIRSALDDEGFTVELDSEGVYVVHGARPERWVRQTNFDNDEAVGYLADRLARLGVEDQLRKMGAEPGAPVRIGTYDFDWRPTIYAGADFTPGNRGSDYRLEDHGGRPTAAQRLAERKSRRIPYEQREAARLAAEAEATALARSARGGSPTGGSSSDGAPTAGSLTDGPLAEGSLTHGSLTDGSLTDGSLTDDRAEELTEDEYYAALAAADKRRASQAVARNAGLDEDDDLD